MNGAPNIEAVILAAGLGIRLRNNDDDPPKFAVKVSDEHLVAYPIKMLASVGVKKFTVVVFEDYADEIREILDGLDGIKYKLIKNGYPEKGNGYSFLLTDGHVGSDNFFVSMCDSLYPRRIPLKLLEKFKKSGADVVVGADSYPLYIDVDEATKIKVDGNGNVVRIGKNLVDFNFVDVGLFVVNKKLYQLKSQLLKREVVEFSDVINKAIENNLRVVVADITGTPWTEIDTFYDLSEVLDGRRKIVLDMLLRELRYS